VKEWLVSKKVAPERLRTKGLGDTKPMDSNSTPEGRANNRRVEFVKF
jgi:outer membrane protein OmpA-like peptidoglycan-associated protein